MISKKLKDLRCDSNKTQQDMAKILGISRQGYAKYENNRVIPDTSTLVQLALFFDVSTDYLLGLSSERKYTSLVIDNPTYLTEELNVFMNDIHNADKDDIEALRRVWDILKQYKDKNLS